MLLQLKIENYALIRELQLEFSSGFTCITGETGAGKSILLGALTLLLGERADRSVLFDKKRKCIVEAIFRINNYNLEEFFQENDLDYDDEITCRREVSDNGKTRTFINDTPVPLNLMRDLGERLVDIHSQNKTIVLNNSDFQLSVVDDYAGHQTLLKEYRKLFILHKETLKRLHELIEKDEKAKSERDYIQFLFEEIEKAEIKAGEQETMEKELELINHAEQIKNNLQASSYLISGQDNNLTGILNEIKNLVTQVAIYHPKIQELQDRILQCILEFKDIDNDISRLADTISYNAEMKEMLQTKLDQLNRLLAKHRLRSDEELISLKNELSEKLYGFDTLGDEISMLQNKTDELFILLKEKASIISANRGKIIPEIEKQIVTLLKSLGIPDAQVNIKIDRTDHLNESGNDQVIMFFNANKGGSMKELAKVASGGELSRLMLSVKSLISTRNLLPTLILDEIDSGISGEVAGRAATIMKRMSEKMQVIAITHLPQIAGKADYHIRASKEIEEGKSVSRINVIKGEDRVSEIAKMLSNENITAASLQTARELLTY